MASIKAAKGTAWTWYSRRIRLRDSLRTTGTTEYCRCITCGRVKEFRQMDAGHFVPGRSWAVLFVDDNTWGQCSVCNRFKQGRFVEFEFALRGLISLERIEELKLLKFQTVKAPRLGDLRAMGERFRLEYEVMKETHDWERFFKEIPWKTSMMYFSSDGSPAMEK